MTFLKRLFFAALVSLSVTISNYAIADDQQLMNEVLVDLKKDNPFLKLWFKEFPSAEQKFRDVMLQEIAKGNSDTTSLMRVGADLGMQMGQQDLPAIFVKLNDEGLNDILNALSDLMVEAGKSDQSICRMLIMGNTRPYMDWLMSNPAYIIQVNEAMNKVADNYEKDREIPDVSLATKALNKMNKKDKKIIMSMQNIAAVNCDSLADLYKLMGRNPEFARANFAAAIPPQ
ncbi:MAG: hypothetical protein ACK5LE_03905 [Alphaproteobacteria bacterium]